MLKKTLIITVLIITVLCTTGCEKNGFTVSELKPSESSYGAKYVSGTVKNVSNKKHCKEIEINFTYKNGSLKDNGYIVIEAPKLGETSSFKDELVFSSSDIENFEDYKITVTNIICRK